MEYLGIDVHSKYSEVCGVSEAGEITVRRRVATTESGLRGFFGGRECSQVVLESGPVTPLARRKQVRSAFGTHSLRVIGARVPGSVPNVVEIENGVTFQ